MTNTDIVLKLKDYAVDPKLQLNTDLVKTMQFAAWRLGDFSACEDELRRLTGAETMRGAVDVIVRRWNGGDSRDAGTDGLHA